MKTHETFLIGMNKDGQIEFLKSYEYLKQKDEAQADFKWVSDNFHSFQFGAMNAFQIGHIEEGEVVETMDIIIPTP